MESTRRDDGPAAVERERSWPATATVVGVACLVATKGADVVTTVVGLRSTAPLAERNPIADAAILEYGLVPGLVGLAALTVLVIVCVVEGSFGLVAGNGDPDAARTRQLGRAVCYGVASACHVGVATHNAALIVGLSAV